MPHANAQTRREYMRKYSRDWYRRNREKDLARQAAWRAANKELLQASRQAFREANRERLNAEQRERRKADPENNLRIWRKSHYKCKYGITVEQYDAMLERQEGRCAICRGEDPGGRFGRFAVDHDHATGAVRGLLCMMCNTTLGRYEAQRARIDAYLAGRKP